MEQLASMALAVAKEGTKEQALIPLNHALDVAQEIDNARHKSSALRSISSALANVGDIKRAMELAEQITDATKKAASLESIASVQAKIGAKQEALATLKHAFEAAQEIDKASYKSSVLSTIALTLATEFAPQSENDDPSRQRRMKKAFSPKEEQLAKQIMEVIQGG